MFKNTFRGDWLRRQATFRHGDSSGWGASVFLSFNSKNPKNVLMSILALI